MTVAPLLNNTQFGHDHLKMLQKSLCIRKATYTTSLQTQKSYFNFCQTVQKCIKEDKQLKYIFQKNKIMKILHIGNRCSIINIQVCLPEKNATNCTG